MVKSVYVDVVVLMSRSGELTPLFIVWDNGIKYKIHKCTKKGQRASEGGGNGILYLIQVEGVIRSLYFNRHQNAWFIEKLI